MEAMRQLRQLRKRNLVSMTTIGMIVVVVVVWLATMEKQLLQQGTRALYFTRKSGSLSEDGIETYLVKDRILRRHVHFPGSSAYARSTRVFNVLAGHERRPRVVVVPETVDHVVRALAFARERKLHVAVKGGGHNIAAKSLISDGMLIDMSNRRRVRLVRSHVSGAYVIVEAGARQRDVDAEIRESPFVVVGATCADVGLVGLALAGGIGWMSRHRGLVAHHVRSAEVILPNGTLVETVRGDALLKALLGSGGGGGLGVVWSMTFDAHVRQHHYFVNEINVPLRKEGLEVRIRSLLRAHGRVLRLLRSDQRWCVTLCLFQDFSAAPLTGNWYVFFDGDPKDALISGRALGLFDALADYLAEYQIESDIRLPVNSVRDGSHFLMPKLTLEQWNKRFTAVSAGGVRWRSSFFSSSDGDDEDASLSSRVNGSASYDAFFDDLSHEVASFVGRIRERPRDADLVLQVMLEHISGMMTTPAGEERKRSEIVSWDHGENPDILVSMYVAIDMEATRDDEEAQDATLEGDTNGAGCDVDKIRGSEALLRRRRYGSTIGRQLDEPGRELDLVFARIANAHLRNGVYSGYADQQEVRRTRWQRRLFGLNALDALVDFKDSIDGANELFCSVEAQQICTLSDRDSVRRRVSGSSLSLDDADKRLDRAIEREVEQCDETMAMRQQVAQRRWRRDRRRQGSSKALVPRSAIPMCGQFAATSGENGKIVVITGGNRGIGLEVTTAMDDLGAALVIAGNRHATDCDGVVRGRSLSSTRCLSLDLSFAASIDAFVEDVRREISRNPVVHHLGRQQCVDTLLLVAGIEEPFSRVDAAAGLLHSASRRRPLQVGRMLMVNNLGQILLLILMEGRGILCSDARIVVETSGVASVASLQDVRSLLRSEPYEDLLKSSGDEAYGGNTLEELGILRSGGDVMAYGASKLLSNFLVDIGPRALARSTLSFVAATPDGTAPTTISSRFRRALERRGAGHLIRRVSVTRAAMPTVSAATGLVPSGSALVGCSVRPVREMIPNASASSACVVWNEALALLREICDGSSLEDEVSSFRPLSCGRGAVSPIPRPEN